MYEGNYPGNWESMIALLVANEVFFQVLLRLLYSALFIWREGGRGIATKEDPGPCSC